MSQTPNDPRAIGRAEVQFREAFERLKLGKPRLLPAGTRLSQNNVAKEAGVDPSALRKSRFPQLVSDIQAWIEGHRADLERESPRQKLLATRSRNRSLREQIEALCLQRDDALSKLVDAEAYIVDLTLENERLRAQLPQGNIVPLRK